jgi:transglutaminase-like putative cysteine protease
LALLLLVLLPAGIVSGEDISSAALQQVNSNGVISVKSGGFDAGKRKLVVEKDGKKYYYDLHPELGEERFPLQMGSGDYKVSIMKNISQNQYLLVKTDTVYLKLDNENAVFLNSVQNISWDESKNAVKLARQMTNGLSDEEKINKIYAYIVNNICFDNDKLAYIANLTDYIPDIDKTLQEKSGICYDFSALFAAMARSVGVPTKLVKGYSDSVVGYHAWNEVYLNGEWKVIDSSYDAQIASCMIKDCGRYKKTLEY